MILLLSGIFWTLRRIGLPQVSNDDLGQGRNVSRGTFGNLRAVIENYHTIGKVRDHLHIVLDPHNGWPDIVNDAK